MQKTGCGPRADLVIGLVFERAKIRCHSHHPARAVWIPEYAHGVPGVLKNGLDWVVGSGELVDKPVTLFNASPRGTYAQASLTETLTVMSAKVVPEASPDGQRGQSLRGR